MSTLSERLRELRGITPQSQFSAELGMKQQQYARYEKGATVPGADILANICKVHAVSADWLLGLEDCLKEKKPRPTTKSLNLDELRVTASQLAEESAALAGTIKKLKKML